MCVSHRSTTGFRPSVKDYIHHHHPQGFSANSTYNEQKAMQTVPRKGGGGYYCGGYYFKAEYLFAQG